MITTDVAAVVKGFFDPKTNNIKCVFLPSTGASQDNLPQQSFRVTPTDVQVAAGDNATLPCEVLNQRGSAQWTQHGFAFGKLMH